MQKQNQELMLHCGEKASKIRNSTVRPYKKGVSFSQQLVQFAIDE